MYTFNKVKLFRYNYKEYFAVFYSDLTYCRFWAIDLEKIEGMYYLGYYKDNELQPVDYSVIQDYSVRFGAKRLYDLVYKKGISKFASRLMDKVKKKPGQPKNVELRKRCVYLRSLNMTIREIAQEVHRDPGLVHRWLKEESADQSK